MRDGETLARCQLQALHRYGYDAVFSDAVDPDDTILDVHLIGHVVQPVLIFAEGLGDTGDGGDVMDLVDVHGQAARTEIADAGGAQSLSNFSAAPSGAVKRAITRQLARLMGGDVSVESRPGEGSSFHFTRPRACR